jgi:FtsH-binding integral membrane protein
VPALPLGHGALAPKADLPIPETWFAWGAAIVLIVSFVALSVAWIQPRFERDSWRPGGRALSSVLVNPITEVLAGLAGVFLLGVVVWSGLYGTQNSAANFNVTFVFVTFWVCLPLVSIFLGDVFRAFNPWRAIGRAIGGVFRRIAGRAAPPPLAYPERLGRWPAVAGLGLFLWFELAYGVPFEPVVIIEPEDVAIATLVYSAITFVGMALFGVEKWCERGETFSVLFNAFSRIAPLEVRDGKLGRRRWFSGAVGWGLVPGSLALVLLLIAGTTYDGAAEGVLAEPIDWLYELINGGADAEGDVTARRITATVFMLLTFAVVSAIYWAGVRGMGTEGSSLSPRELGRTFAFCFIPIAAAYVLAHYFSLVVFQEQAQFTYLLSDPLGEGSDLFGTADGGVDLRAVSSEQIWYAQVASLVAGHVAALAMGHDKALAVYKNLRRATQSQYWMLALMVSFTVLGLALLSAANQ